MPLMRFQLRLASSLQESRTASINPLLPFPPGLTILYHQPCPLYSGTPQYKAHLLGALTKCVLGSGALVRPLPTPPISRNDLPNHEPRGCPRGASYSWYIYSANRLKYPKVRKPLLKLWREARATLNPVEAWASIVSDPAKAESYKSKRGMGGFIRSSWEEI